MSNKPITVPRLKQMKQRGEKISMLTAYDYTFAKLMDQSGTDMILVGDSLGMVVQGHDSTLPVTMDEIIYHTKCVRRAVKRAMLVADMPFMSYQVGAESALINAGRLMKEAGADAVKLEGGQVNQDAIKRMVGAGIPVMGHVGLGPQSCKQLGGHKVQGKDIASIQVLMDDAKAAQNAGAFSVVIEAVPWPVAERITQSVTIPTIGIGAGPYCDGQVLVYADMLGLFTAFQPHFVRRFTQMGDEAMVAFESFTQSVKDGSFPSIDESYPLDQETMQLLNADRFLRKQH